MYVHVKVVVIYHSETERVYRLALAATEAAWDAGAEVRVRRVGRLVPPAGVHQRPEWSEILRDMTSIPEARAADLAWADAALFGTAAPNAAVVDRLRQFADATTPLWRTGQLAEKVYGVFTPTAPAHHGAGSRLVTLTDLFHQWSGIVVPLELRDAGSRQIGASPGAARQANGGAPSQSELDAARSQGHRATETVRALKAGRRVLADVA
jgi:NAD(P)H dehydrogenase (quinone)